MPPWIMLAHVSDLCFSPQFYNPFGSFLNVELPEKWKRTRQDNCTTVCDGIASVVCVHNTCGARICANIMRLHIQAACVVCAISMVKQCQLCKRCAQGVQAVYVSVCASKSVQVCCRVNFILFVYATRVQVVQAPAIVSLRIFFVSQTFFRIAGVLYLVPF